MDARYCPAYFVVGTGSNAHSKKSMPAFPCEYNDSNRTSCRQLEPVWPFRHYFFRKLLSDTERPSLPGLTPLVLGVSVLITSSTRPKKKSSKQSIYRSAVERGFSL